MSDTGRFVRLLENQIYPTYQLFAVMANRKTKPSDGLRLGALTAMEWLRQRLGDKAPDALRQPDPAQFRGVGDECLVPLHINRGFVIDIVSLPEQGIWSLQVTEPDLGSNPGSASQSRAAVPGRVIETNVSFTVNGLDLECGFQTVVSDPTGTEHEAEVYRLAIIRRLIDNPDFGLEQGTRLSMAPAEIASRSQINDLLSLVKSQENQIPCVVFTHLRVGSHEQGGMTYPAPSAGGPELPLSLIPKTQAGVFLGAAPCTGSNASKVTPKLPNYDIDGFSEKNASFCRTYLLADSLFEHFTSTLNLAAECGDILVLEPTQFGGKPRAVRYKPSKSGREESLELLSAEMHTYSKGKDISFGKTRFLSAARESLFQATSIALQQSESVAVEWNHKIALLQATFDDCLKEKDSRYALLAEQLDRNKQNQAKLEGQLAELRETLALNEKENKLKLADKDAQIAYLKRKATQPKDRSGIAAWAAKTFPDTLVIHRRVPALLADKATRSVDVELICDALDYLATDYWELHYQYISNEEMNTRCSEKYHHRFSIGTTGPHTLAHFASDYYVKYLWLGHREMLSTPLDFHLRVGRTPENLVRIYFFHDDDRRKIVIGSLPAHLRCESSN